jgi:hypothetical protein
MKDGFPEHYEILPHSVERVAEVARKVGKFIHGIVFNTNVPLHVSNHYIREHFHAEESPQGKLPFGE